MKTGFFASLKNGLADTIRIWRQEYISVFKDMGAMLFFFVLPFAYPLLYAFIYNPEVVRDVPLAVVDNSRTVLSRELCRRVDASPNTKIISYCANLDEAKDLMYSRVCHGIMEIPEDFSKKVVQSEQSPVLFYSDMSILINYKNFLATLTEVTLDMGKELQSEKLVGATAKQIDMATNPIPGFSIVLYNPTGGFASFIMPALLIVILQQSIILGIGLLAGGRNERRKLSPENPHENVWHLLFGKSACYYSLYIMTVMYMLHIIPWLFDYPQLGNQWNIYIFLLPFLLSSIFFGITLSALVRERESVFLVIVFTSMVFLFVSGVTWPYDRMPLVWRVLGGFIPATWGVEGFLRMSSEGATMPDVKEEFYSLWGLTLLYFFTAYGVIHYRQWKERKALAAVETE